MVKYIGFLCVPQVLLTMVPRNSTIRCGMLCGERYERRESEYRPQKVSRWKGVRLAGLHCPYAC